MGISQPEASILMVDLEALAYVAQIVSGAAVLGGVLFAIVQLREFRNQRLDAAAVDIVRAIQTQEIRQAGYLVLGLPDDMPPEQVRGDPKVLVAALAMDSACEMWGTMVYEGVVPLDMLDRMVGGWVRGAWRKLHLWIEDERRRTGNVNVAEWWQWVVERLMQFPDPGKAAGAYVSHRLWRP